MTKWTKADIDGLVDNAPAAHERWIRSFQQDVRTQLYLAAGLTATGEVPRHPMETERGYAIVGVPAGDLTLNWRTGLANPLTYAIYPSPPTLDPGMETTRRVARVEIREIPE